jgi:hypothetical protein
MEGRQKVAIGTEVETGQFSIHEARVCAENPAGMKTRKALTFSSYGAWVNDWRTFVLTCSCA